jgi:hypothetical protein
LSPGEVLLSLIPEV